MSMSDWAKREVELACKRENPDRKDGEWDYGCACYESALKAYLSLCEDGHSGMSFSFTRNILNRLMYECPLTPIEDNEEDWNLVHEKDGTKQYQCRRMYSLFKYVYPCGKVEYSANNYYCIDEESGVTYSGGGADKILKEYAEPITMPYFPSTKKYEIHTQEYLTDRKNGDYDTKAYLYIICPDGKRIDVYKYFGETEEGWKELTSDEFTARYAQHLERVRKEKEQEENTDGV